MQFNQQLEIKVMLNKELFVLLLFVLLLLYFLLY